MDSLAQDAFNNINGTKEACENRKARFKRFLNDFTVVDEAEPQSQTSQGSAGNSARPPQKVYINQLATLKERELRTLYVNYEHLAEFDQDLAMDVVEAYYRLEPYLRAGLYDFVKQHLDTYAENEDGMPKEFWVSFYNLEHNQRLRQLRSDKIGHLSQFVGTVTRTTEVRPELFKGTFRCIQCMSVVRDVEQQFKYTTPTICPTPNCGNKNKWSLVMEQSIFVDWQKAKVQENPDEVPAGSLPRTIEVVLRNDQVETVRPGDKAVFAGSLVVVPDVSALTAPGERLSMRLSGINQSNQVPGDNNISGLTNGPAKTGLRELTYRLAFIACGTKSLDTSGGMVNIRADEDLSPEEVLTQMNIEQQEGLEEMRRDRALYDRMADSIAPNVFGHTDVKRAVLLMLLGGVQKSTKEGIKLRGDINVAIVGDPACAKSQLLKYVSAFLPRAVYTSGKASSAAGLTASVVREADSGEFCIEAGALMLADNGICCIDEFDKMDVKDQVAIHEAMEQQTISIAKAGIQATLNARTSILAAANPASGRYDRSKPLRYNVALPPAILSRFDLLHVMIDEPDQVLDAQIANHILSVHQGAGAALNPPYGMERMQCYIKYARSIKPRIPEAAQKQLVQSYKRLRSDDAAPGSATAYRITVRQLEALVRLSEALARLHLREEVTRNDVKEAYRLVKNSIVAVDMPDAELEEEVFDDVDEIEAMADGEGQQEAQEQQEPNNTATAAAVAPAADGAENQEGGDGEEAAAAAGGAAAPRPAAKSTVKVPQAKYNNVKQLLVMRLKQLESEDGDDVERREIGLEEIVGAKQRDLLRWYFDYMVQKEAIKSKEQGVDEIVLAEKVVAHLIKREQVLIVIDQPTRNENESSADFNKRVKSDRLLALNPNYAFE